MDNLETSDGKNQELPPLPFTYVKTDDESKADIKVWQYKIDSKYRTKEELLERARATKEDALWYASKEWREKGTPFEQIEFQVGDKEITVYNYNEKKFTDEHIKKFQQVLIKLAEHFPKILERLRWVLINDKQGRSVYGDEKEYPLNGSAWVPWKVFKLQPRGMEMFPHRIIKTTNFEGTLIHELSHLIADDFYQEWTDVVRWQHITDLEKKDREDWESRKTPDSGLKAFYNKKTGEMAPNGKIPLQPEQCVTKYARIKEDEDFCESMVAYFYDPELLKRVSPEKFEIIKKHDAKKPIPKIEVKRIPKDQIKLPEIKPETVYYFVKEPAEKEMIK
ncbi:hypothetical protein HYW46_07220 [Candidatus Daviesbacteria bacterium]|nr:hypothetical protein [Candidatus Daviesbacteria bacterium]